MNPCEWNELKLKMTSTAQKLEQQLGPLDEGPLDFNSILRSDNSGEFAFPLVDFVNKTDFNKFCLPSCFGGSAEHFHQTQQIIRCLARRDISLTAIKAVTFFAALPVWIGGNDQQKDFINRMLIAKSEVCLGLTEREAGSDLLNTQFQAKKVSEENYELNGEKWLINNAEVSSAKILLTRTNSSYGPRSLTMFMVPQELLSQSTYNLDRKVPLSLTRNMNVGAFSVQNLKVGAEWRLGAEGHGLDLTLKSLQVSRTSVASLSLGALESSLSLATHFLIKRKLYGGSVSSLPVIKSKIARIYSTIMMLDCFTWTTSRLFHARPQALSLYSAISKYAIQQIADQTMLELTNLVGARSFITSGEKLGLIQKFLRDTKLLSIFDGSTFVNLQLISSFLPQFKRLASYEEEASLKSDLIQKDPLWCWDKLRTFHFDDNGLWNWIKHYGSEESKADQKLIEESLGNLLIEDIRSRNRYWTADKIAKMFLLENFNFFIRENSDRENEKLYIAMFKLIANKEGLSFNLESEENLVFESLVNRIEKNKALGLFEFELSHQ